MLLSIKQRAEKTDLDHWFEEIRVKEGIPQAKIDDVTARFHQ